MSFYTYHDLPVEIVTPKSGAGNWGIEWYCPTKKKWFFVRAGSKAMAKSWVADYQAFYPPDKVRVRKEIR